jgi:hypothetical protein
MTIRECKPARSVSAIARNLRRRAQPSKNMTIRDKVLYLEK